MKALLDSIRLHIERRVMFIFAAGLAVAIILAGVIAGNVKSVTINNNGNTETITTMNTTVGEVLKDLNINVSEDDYLNLTLDTRLWKSGVIDYKRAVNFKVTVDGKTLSLYTLKSNLKDALADKKIALGTDDRIEGASLGDSIKEGMSVNIHRVLQNTITVQESLPFGTIRKDNNFLAYGTEQLVSEGSEGLISRQYKIVYEDGKEKSRELIAENVVTQPVSRVVERGTILSYTASRGITFNYRAAIDMSATAYNCENNYGITYTGEMVRKGIIAVDPSVIPLGSLVYVEVPGGEDYGYAIAADIGGGIIGNKIDVYLESYEAAVIWGVTPVKVYIIQ